MAQTAGTQQSPDCHENGQSLSAARGIMKLRPWVGQQGRAAPVLGPRSSACPALPQFGVFTQGFGIGCGKGWYWQRVSWGSCAGLACTVQSVLVLAHDATFSVFLKNSHLLRVPSLWNGDLMTREHPERGQCLLLLPVPVPYGFNIRTINPLQAACHLPIFWQCFWAFTVMNCCHHKILDVGYSTISSVCSGNWLIQAKIRTSYFIFICPDLLHGCLGQTTELIFPVSLPALL